MDLRLYSIDRAPTNTSIWRDILNDLGSPSAKRIAKVLNVSVRTVERWNATGDAPKAACMALFWLTRWGRSEVDTAATNDALIASQLATSLKQERDFLRHQVERAKTAELEAKRRLTIALTTLDRAITAGFLNGPQDPKKSQNETNWRGVTKAPPTSGAPAEGPAHTVLEQLAQPLPKRRSPKQRPLALPRLGTAQLCLGASALAAPCGDPFAQLVSAALAAPQPAAESAPDGLDSPDWGAREALGSGERASGRTRSAATRARGQDLATQPSQVPAAQRPYWGPTPSPPEKRAVRPDKAPRTRLTEPSETHPWRKS